MPARAAFDAIFPTGAQNNAGGMLPCLTFLASIDCGCPIRSGRSFMSAQRFAGKVAVVTGGNSGIGLGVAKAYAREGAQVAITGRNDKTLQEAAAEIGSGTLAI